MSRLDHVSPGAVRAISALTALIGLAAGSPRARAQEHAHHPPPRPHAAADSVRLDTTATMPGMSMARRPARDALPAPLGIPMNRAGSGTSWLPDAAPMHAHHVQAGDWELMLHYIAFGYYDRQADADPQKRGDDQVGSVNWAMLMAMRAMGGGRLQLRGMLSAEPWTVGAKGYPLLLQSGESFHGLPLHDRQHPHDLVMELAALYEKPVSSDLALELYVAPVGEPASGPVAYPHRPSAAADPFAPLGHHWQDATHISFGVVTAGVFARAWKLEGSLFNGREPDEHRTDFDFRRLDSWAGRVTVNPGRAWSLSASYAYLASPEALAPRDAEHRIGASILNTRPFGARGEWSSALVYGANEHSADHRLSHSALLETNLDLDGTNTLFGRVEYVNKSSEDLALEDALPGRHFDVGSAVLGYAREIAAVGDASLAVGARASLDVVPRSLVPVYGTRTPSGFALFMRLRPESMRMAMRGAMHAHDH